jgi:2Fe-2S ferredoxin
MPNITFVDHEGMARIVDAPAGISLMEVARMNDIPGIDADCGGVCACATCHVFVDADFLHRMNPQTDCEEPMLEFVDDARENSRLSCQVVVTDELDGLRVTTPAAQK